MTPRNPHTLLLVIKVQFYLSLVIKAQEEIYKGMKMIKNYFFKCTAFLTTALISACSMGEKKEITKENQIVEQKTSNRDKSSNTPNTEKDETKGDESSKLPRKEDLNSLSLSVQFNSLKDSKPTSETDSSSEEDTIKIEDIKLNYNPIIKAYSNKNPIILPKNLPKELRIKIESDKYHSKISEAIGNKDGHTKLLDYHHDLEENELVISGLNFFFESDHNRSGSISLKNSEEADKSVHLNFKTHARLPFFLREPKILDRKSYIVSPELSAVAVFQFSLENKEHSAISVEIPRTSTGQLSQTFIVLSPFQGSSGLAYKASSGSRTFTERFVILQTDEDKSEIGEILKNDHNKTKLVDLEDNHQAVFTVYAIYPSDVRNPLESFKRFYGPNKQFYPGFNGKDKNPEIIAKESISLQSTTFKSFNIFKSIKVRHKSNLEPLSHENTVSNYPNISMDVFGFDCVYATQPFNDNDWIKLDNLYPIKINPEIKKEI